MRYKVLGNTSDITTCQQCGRAGLKKTVALAALDADGNRTEVVYFGVDCAAHATRWSQRDIRRAAADGDAQEQENAARYARYATALAEWDAAEREVSAEPGYHSRIAVWERLWARHRADPDNYARKDAVFLIGEHAARQGEPAKAVAYLRAALPALAPTFPQGSPA